MIELKGVSKTYLRGEVQIQALNAVDLAIAAREFSNVASAIMDSLSIMVSFSIGGRAHAAATANKTNNNANLV